MANTKSLASTTPRQVHEELFASVQLTAESLLEGASEDMQGFVAEVNADLVLAMATGSNRWMEELVGQLEAVGEKHRLAVAHGTWDTVRQVMLSLARFGAVALRAGVVA